MCAGYYKLLVAAKQEKKILVPNPQFDKEQVRYEHRFGTFATLLTPPLMPYSQFKVIRGDLLNNRFTICLLYEGSIRTHRKSRSRCPLHGSLQRFRASSTDTRICSGEKISNIKTFLKSISMLQPSSEEDFSALITVNKNNFVVASVLARDKSRGIDFDFSLHINFPTVKLA